MCAFVIPPPSRCVWKVVPALCLHWKQLCVIMLPHHFTVWWTSRSPLNFQCFGVVKVNVNVSLHGMKVQVWDSTSAFWLLKEVFLMGHKPRTSAPPFNFFPFKILSPLIGYDPVNLPDVWLQALRKKSQESGAAFVPLWTVGNCWELLGTGTLPSCV